MLLIGDLTAVGDFLMPPRGRTLDICAVASGEDALDLMDRGTRFDAILYDTSPSGMSGRTFHAILRARSPEQASRVMLMTHGSRGEIGFSRRRGSRWLWKPLEMTDLVSAVTSVATSCANAATQRLVPMGGRSSA